MISELTKRLYDRIKFLEVPEETTYKELHQYIVDAIRQLYVATGRVDLAPNQSNEFDEIMLNLDEQEWVVLTAQCDMIKYNRKVKGDIASYSIDAGYLLYHTREEAMDIFLGPENHMIDLIEKQRQVVWTRMMVFKGV